jgi:parvulin-like peptidyl-prolyl isomerase
VKKLVVASIVVLVLAAVVGLVVGCGEGDLPNDAVAKVGDTYITQEQFDTRMAAFEAQYAGYMPDKEEDPEGYRGFQLNVVDYMVMYEMAKQKAPSYGLELPDTTVTDAEVQTEIDKILNDYYQGDQAKFDEALAAQSMTLDGLKTAYKASMLYEKESTFLQSLYDAVTKDVTTVPDDEIAAYYEEHKAEYFTDETRTVRHILISPTPDEISEASTTTTTSGSTSSSDDSSTASTESTTTTVYEPTQADWDTALETANKVKADLTGGADWTAEAAEFSDDPGSKDMGGDLGEVAKGEMVAEFENAVFSLKLNEISEPIKTTYGYHVIQVTGITEAKQSTLDEVKDEITTTLLNEKKTEVWDQWLIDTKSALGVVYKEGMEPTTTTTSATTATTVGPGDTTTRSEAPSTTDSGEATTTTAAGQTITTAAPSTTTTAKP